MPADFQRPEWDPDRYPGRHVAPVGAQAGARELAANVYELDAGAVGAPLHAHHANEEMLFVLAGTLSLRDDHGARDLTAGAVAVCPRGESGVHSLVNRSDSPVRYLVVSTANRPDVLTYPDIGATLVLLEDQRQVYPNGSAVAPEPIMSEAMQAAIDRLA